MEHIRSYLITITSAAIVCCVLIRLSDNNGTISSVVKFLASLFMVVTVIKPISGFGFSEIKIFPDEIYAEATFLAEQGNKQSLLELETVIIEKTQAYIKDKARELGAEIQVHIGLEGNIPANVVIEGSVSPFARSQLSSWIAENIGIPREAQRWIG